MIASGTIIIDGQTYRKGDVASGSTALCVDTGELYGFYAPDSKWFLL